MTKENITINNQNNEWLEKRLSNKEYTSKSELINYLIEQERERDEYNNYVQMKIDRGLESGFTTITKEELLEEIKSRLNVSI